MGQEKGFFRGRGESVCLWAKCVFLMWSYFHGSVSMCMSVCVGFGEISLIVYFGLSEWFVYGISDLTKKLVLPWILYVIDCLACLSFLPRLSELLSIAQYVLARRARYRKS